MGQRAASGRLVADTGVALKSLEGVHPRAEAIREQLDWLGAAHLLGVEAGDGPPALVAHFDTPHGTRTLR